MTAQNVQNQIPLKAGQNFVPAQSIPSCAPVQSIPVQTDPRYQLNQPVQNNLNNNYIPRYMPLIQQGQVYPVALPQPQPAQCAQQGTKGGSVGTVNITINGVNAPGQGATAPTPQYCPPYAPYYLPQLPANNLSQEVKKEPLATTPIEQKPEVPKAEQPKTEEKKPETNNKKPVKELTDGYIKELEKNLNNKDKDTRTHAVAELVNRFKEDETRKDDQRLTNLLNLALEDESKPIVYAAMQAIDNGYANGNAVTEQRLQTIRDKQDKFGNSETAEQLLSKISERKLSQKAPDSATPIKGNSENINSVPGQKLNLMAG